MALVTRTGIVLDPVDGVSRRSLRWFVLGTGLRAWCHLRGYLVLHGSCVRTGGKAYAFVGPSRRGKSTLAAALYDRGHGVVADDVVAVDPQDQTVRPAFPGLKLSDAAAATLPGFEVPDRQDDGGVERKYYSVPRGFPTRDVELGGIVVLTEDARLPATETAPGEGVHQVSRAAFAPEAVLDEGDARDQFEQQTSLVESVSVRKAGVPDGLDRVREAAADLV